eukprot:scaffold568723_cov18-Prasinocladus_malaysianus.AAC.1
MAAGSITRCKDFRAIISSEDFSIGSIPCLDVIGGGAGCRPRVEMIYGGERTAPSTPLEEGK